MPHPKVKISDNDGNTVAVDTSGGSNALKVALVAGTLIDIGDVDIHLSGHVPLLGGDGDVAPGVLRVTLADDDAHFGAIGASADIDGNIHGQLRYIANSQVFPASGNALNGYQAMGTVASVASLGKVMLAERNDTLAIPSGVDTGDWASLQVNASGALYVEVASSAALTTKQFTSDNATNGKVSVLNSSTEICDASAVRLSYTIVNDSDTVIYLAIEDAAVLNEGIRLNPNGGSFSDEFATDKVFGICAVSGKNVTVCQQFI